MDYLKIGQASDLEGGDKLLYRILEIFPGFFSWATLLLLVIFSYLKPVWVSFFIIAFDIYWLLLVVFLGIHLISAYQKLKENLGINWKQQCVNLSKRRKKRMETDCLARRGVDWKDVFHLVILPISYEGIDVIRPTLEAIVRDSYPLKRMILVLATEERAGEDAQVIAQTMKKEFGENFRNFLITKHPDNLEGELKGKGANQTWAIKLVKKQIIDKDNLDYNKVLVSVFDIDTIIHSGYFYCLTYKFLTTKNPYRASYQPVPFYHNNIWYAPFFARVAATSNTFWQMMQQIRDEKLATYSSHSMTMRALVDIGFWATNMVSEDSRITWHCYMFYNGDYRVEPLHFPVSMDTTTDKNIWRTMHNLYKQQRRWGWGVENLPYLIFNFFKKWPQMPKWKTISRILVQIYGFHSWATNALIIGVIGWMPLILGGSEFNSFVLSGNLPFVTRFLMIAAMIGMVTSAIISTLLLPRRPREYGFWKTVFMVVQWLILPFSIIIFGAIPGLEAQSRLMLGKRLGFYVTPKGVNFNHQKNI